MREFLDDVKEKIENTICDLFDNKDLYHCVDLDATICVIQDFVLADVNKNTIDDNNRYEYYYQLLGMAVAIAQGWKINCVKSLKLPSETKQSLMQYIENTYGKRINSY